MQCGNAPALRSPFDTYFRQTYYFFSKPLPISLFEPNFWLRLATTLHSSVVHLWLRTFCIRLKIKFLSKWQLWCLYQHWPQFWMQKTTLLKARFTPTQAAKVFSRHNLLCSELKASLFFCGQKGNKLSPPNNLIHQVTPWSLEIMHTVRSGYASSANTYKTWRINNKIH